MRSFVNIKPLRKFPNLQYQLKLGHDSPISVVERVILPFCEDFIFHETSHMRSFEKIKPSRKFPNLQYQ